MKNGFVLNDIVAIFLIINSPFVGNACTGYIAGSSTMGSYAPTRSVCLLLVSVIFISSASSLNTPHNRLAQDGGNKCKVSSYYSTPTCASGSVTHMEYSPVGRMVHECMESPSEGMVSADVLSSDCGTVIDSDKAGTAVVTAHVFSSKGCTGARSLQRQDDVCIKYPQSMGGSTRTYSDETGRWVWSVNYDDSDCE